MLPQEAEFSEAISRELPLELGLAAKMLQVCVSIIEERNPRQPPNDSEAIAYQVANALCVKACKAFRSIHRLALIGATHDIDILCRALFETTVATVFVLRPTVQLGINGFDDAWLTSELRARIYAAMIPIRKYRDFSAIKRDGRFPKAIVDCINEEQLAKAAEEARRDVGLFWSERLSKAPKTYSGFTLRDLATKLDPDLSKWYTVVYVLQSKKVHAADAVQHVKTDQNTGQMLAKWHTSVDGVRDAIISACSLLLKCFWELDERYDFDESPNDDKDATRFELQCMVATIGALQRKHYPEVTFERAN